ncbi:Uncharacterised protein [Mycobacteroides abscessus subsp. abscessus]|nr:Uncharacterised protein [Mycobacteroides abscessus subsp. abscessus]SKW00211.1 Uncharacterised protein [Mycobacteroides abscessus subsp. abscessus]
MCLVCTTGMPLRRAASTPAMQTPRSPWLWMMSMGPRARSSRSISSLLAAPGHTKVKSSCLPSLRMASATNGTGLTSTTFGSGSTVCASGAVNTVTLCPSRSRP